MEVLNSMPSTLFSDRPVGLNGDLLWRNHLIHEQINEIAQRMVAPLRDEPEATRALGMSDSITFAVYGKWGMGKSSALQMLRERAGELAKASGGEGRIHFCTYLAPAYEFLPNNDVRTTLLMRIMTALANDNPQQAVDYFLPDALNVAHDQDTIVPTAYPSSQTSWAMRSLQGVAETFVNLVGLDRVVMDFLQRVAADTRPHVLVVMIDDLDRVQSSFMWKVLDAVQQFSAVENLFFVLAVDHDQLRQTIQERFAQGDGAANPDFALEKYVQYAITVPDMDQDRLRQLVQSLLERYAHSDRAAQALLDNPDFLVFGLRERTPRSVKRCINTIRLDLARRLQDITGSIQRQQIVKERILEYVWPTFYDHDFKNAMSKKTWDPRWRRAFMALESASRDYVATQDEEQFRFDMRRIASNTGIDWSGLSLDQVRYLGLPPFWFVETGPAKEASQRQIRGLLYGLYSEGSPEPTPTPLVAADLEATFLQLYYQGEAAEARGDRTEALRYVEEVYRLVIANRRRFNKSHCPTVGNAAITAEKFGAIDLALKMYVLARELDPEHSNNLQNFLDFIVTKRVEEQYELAKQLLEKLKTPPHSAFRPERTLALEAQLMGLQGASLTIDPATIAQLVEEFQRAPDDRRKYVSLMSFLDQVGNTEAMRDATRLYYASAHTPETRYLAIRGLADMLAASQNEDDASEAIEMYRYLLADPESNHLRGDDGDLADTLHNLASVYYRLDYDDYAGELWFQAYNLRPNDSSIRKSYSHYLLRARRPDLAARVAEGVPLEVTEPILQSHVKDLPASFLDADFDRWWEK